ncbi:MAG TPA: thrombospondin type 3 repeat-containing protein, partial [Tepidisphaeraceae bacterium]|nr:thrombospondin type 3 repeat-containing protein [Tepidisphaeraceae bacterium]
RNYTFGVHADDVVVRFIRSRMGDTSRSVGDSIWVSFGNRVVLDHVSASWSTDESLSVAQGYKRPGVLLGDVTVQWSIISESLCKSVNPDGRHCYGSIINGSRGAKFTFHHNLWAMHAARMPRLGNSLSPAQDADGGYFDLRNNVFYDWGGDEAGYGGLPAGKINYNLVGNVYIPGPDSRAKAIFKEGNPAARGFIAGNTIEGRAQKAALEGFAGGVPQHYLLSTPVPLPAVRTDNPVTAYEKVLAFAGASLKRDSADERVLAAVRNRAGRLIDSQSDVGGWPVLAAGTPWIDHDGDGMPDSWERGHGLNPNDPRDGNQDRDGDGYTNIEEWLNALAAPAMPH